MSMTQSGTLQLDSKNPVEETGGNTKTFTQVTFPTPFPQGSQVVVIPFVQTFNGPYTPGIRIADVTHQGFKIRLNEVLVTSSVKSDGYHATETVGWMATTV
ncbi:hypothetical protein ABZV14_19565 [Streptosporangium canum]|uniref:hypothetical protein n=1 Tax=Streptosporangium canum TaxID=324952 RepID=UPI0033AF8528